VRAIGIDYGTRRTGIAIGDTGTHWALPFEMFEKLTDDALVDAIAKLCQQEGIEQIVIGIPQFADGRSSLQSKITQQFIDLLKSRTALPVAVIDEHLTSHDAEGKLAGHYTRLQKRQRVDALAAARILQDYFDKTKPPPEPRVEEDGQELREGDH
jgi:putative Holliday junction resolvase